MSNEIIEISGIAHIALNVSEIEQSKKFYKELLPSIGLKLVHESEKSCYHIGGKTGILIQQILENNNYVEFSQKNIGLHHLCFRARSKEDVNKIGKKLINIKANIIRGPMYGNWVPGYYYIVFEDPDRIRLEINYVPNKGVFNSDINFNPGKDY